MPTALGPWHAGCGRGGTRGRTGGRCAAFGVVIASAAATCTFRQGNLHTTFQARSRSVCQPLCQPLSRPCAVHDAVQQAIEENVQFDVRANFNTLIAVTGVILFWRGVWNTWGEPLVARPAPLRFRSCWLACACRCFGHKQPSPSPDTTASARNGCLSSTTCL